MVAPLIDITKKGEFRWKYEAHRTFENMKEVMRTCPVLALPNFTQPFLLECDASGEGIGIVLMQHRHSIAYERRKLTDSETLFHI